MSRCRCANFDAEEYQRFPTTGVLSERKRFDQHKESLRRLIQQESDAVYAYVMSSVVLDGDRLQQRGTGPNFQGGYITLCTCKHRMRTSLPSEEWPGKWVAGFTSVKCGGRHWLFYLAKVKQAYESQSELWHALPPEARRAKSARWSIFGDLYEPKPQLDCVTQFDPSHYYTPISGHSHHAHSCDNGWRIDIDYSRKNLKLKAKRRSCLLVCDPQFSFLWRKPLLYVNGSWRHTIYGKLEELLRDLNQAR